MLFIHTFRDPGLSSRRRAIVLFVLLLGLLPEKIQAPSGILVDQLGYRPDDPKHAFIRENHGAAFEVWNTVTDEKAYAGKIRTVGTPDLSTGDAVFDIDFSGLTAPGTYQLRIPGTQVRSAPFRIGADVYNTVAMATLESFYYQRCGIDLRNGTAWNHPGCHLNDAVLYDDPSRHRDVTGGWHDAGDYGKFTVTAAVSAAFLLYLYELQPGKFTDRQLNIPEAGNGIPDILDEARWELQWLLKMQSEDGGVYHKVSTKKWTGEYLPQDDPDVRYIFPVSSAATGSFSAVSALGARVFARWDKQFAFTLLRASIAGWKYLENHRTIVPAGGFRNPEGVEGGEYGDQRDEDERLWASVELFRTTGNDDYRRYFLANYERAGGLAHTVSWGEVQNFAYSSYLKLPMNESDFRARSWIMAGLLTLCDNLLKRVEMNGYRCVLNPDEYYWGSNSVAAGYAFDLIQGYEATKQARYLDAAVDQLHYLLGRNTFNISFVTGVGANPVRHPYHQFSMKLHVADPVPGLLAGGPNRFSKLHGATLSQYPARCYEDDAKNYFVNEVAINYTAPLAFLAGYAGSPGEPLPVKDPAHKQSN